MMSSIDWKASAPSGCRTFLGQDCLVKDSWGIYVALWKDISEAMQSVPHMTN